MGVETAFQQGIYTALTGNAALTSVCSNVYDIAPQVADAAGGYPYITIGATVFTELDTDGIVGFAAMMRLHTYTATGRLSDCKTIQGLVFDVLHRASLTVTGYNCYSLLREDSDTTPLGDGVVHGVCEYRALLETS